MQICLKNKKLFWLFLVLSLTACGFHLRGAFQLPEELSTVYLGAKSSTVLVEDLRLILKTNGSLIVSDVTKANSSITIEKEKNTQRVISVDSSGRAREYELTYEVVFSVKTHAENEKSKINIENKKLKLIRDYVYDSEAVLGKSREKNILIRDMQRDASRLIMLQTQAAYRQINSQKSMEEKSEDNNSKSVTESNKN